MNVIQIVSSNRASGTESQLVVLAAWLQRRGHQVLAICPPGGWLPGRLREANVPTLEMKMHGMSLLTAAFRLRELARENQIDVIHTHLTRATYIGHLAGRLAHIPVISTVHVVQRNVAYRYLPTCKRSVVAVSEYLRQSLIARGVPPDRVQTIYNGTDFHEEVLTIVTPDDSVRVELDLPPGSLLIGLFGQINAFKGSPLLVQAASRIVGEFPNAYFVFVGAARPKFQESLLKMAARDGVADRLRFTGVRDDVPRLMRAMEVITLPSQYETFGMVIIEAMALGKPVVATRAGGIPEIVQDHETGLLIERTPEALADALISILSDTPRRHRMGAAARHRAETRFAASVMVQQVEDLYRNLVDLN